jgi:LuxR family maltose regulon positive regulatory protein
MPSELLQSKLYKPPLRPMLVARPRLLARLDRGLVEHHSLALVSAPAGFGKTTLISDWGAHLAAAEQPAARLCWLSLDEDDNDPRLFFSYVAAAAGQAEDFGASIQDLLAAPQPAAPKAMAAALINDCAGLDTPLALVLDDYHLIENPDIHQALSYLLDNRPLGLFVIITSRMDPALPLPRWRAGRQMTEIRTDDLRFTLAEAADFLAQSSGQTLAEREVKALEQRTEGWAAGLQMAALSLQDLRPGQETADFVDAFAGSHRYIFDYLADEVLAQRPAGTREFLLKTSILDQLNGALCDAVLGRPRRLPGETSSQALLAQLDAANLFIVPLDDERRTYRYHHLFAYQLHHRLEDEYPDEAPALHIRASAWYEANGWPVAAIRHAMKAGDLIRAARIVEVAGVEWLARSELGLLMRWLSAMPADLIRDRPNLGLLLGWGLALINQFDQVEETFNAAELGFEAALARPETMAGLGLESAAHRARFRGFLATGRAALARSRGDGQAAVALLNRALETLPESELAGRSVAYLYLGYALWSSGDLPAARQTFEEARRAGLAGEQILSAQSAMDALGKILLELGDLNAAHRLHQGGLQLAEQYTSQTGWPLPGVGLAHNGLAAVLYERDELTQARGHAERAMELFRPWGVTENLLDSLHTLARIKLGQDDVDGALALVEQTAGMVQEPNVPDWLTAMIMARSAAVIIVALGEDAPGTGLVSGWQSAAGLDPEDTLTYAREAEYITLVRLLLVQGKFADALNLAERLTKLAESGGRRGRLLEILVLQARAMDSVGETADAVSILERALALAEVSKYRRVFLNEDQPMAGLLEQAASRGRRPAYARQLLAAFADQEAAATKVRQPLADPLTEREVEVLGYMAAGLTGPQIAAELHLSNNTIKTHTKNIYGKLGVNDRAGAIARGREVGLLGQ